MLRGGVDFDLLWRIVAVKGKVNLDVHSGGLEWMRNGGTPGCGERGGDGRAKVNMGGGQS